MIPLALVRPGSTVRVIEIRGGRGVYSKLRSLGIIEGKILKVISSINGGPVIVEIADSIGSSPRIVLGFGMCMKIFVEEA